MKEGVDNDIVCTGLQKDEKMHAEKFYETEKSKRSSHEKVFICRNGYSKEATFRHHNNARNHGSEESFAINRDISLLVEAT